MAQTKGQILQKFMNRDRHVRHGKVALNLLRYDVEWVVRRWGYFSKESTCKFFEYVVSLFKEDLGEDAKKQKQPNLRKSDALPVEEPAAPAIAVESDAAGVTEEESL